MAMNMDIRLVCVICGQPYTIHSLPDVPDRDVCPKCRERENDYDQLLSGDEPDADY